MITKKAYAKLNLFLNVKGKRDDGYHDLEMVNIMVGLYDELEFTLTDGEIICDTSKSELNSKNNLSYKVAVYLKKLFRVQKGVKIFIFKNIPVGSGMGGGSSDAAVTIEALNELWNLNLSFEQMFEISKNFGSDTPYCFYRGPAVVKGTGFDITPIDLDISNFDIMLFTPKVNVSTGVVFSSLINNNKYSLDDAVLCLKSKDYNTFIKGLHNDLEDTVFNMYPEVKAQYDILKRVHGPEGLFMTGSGSTIVKIKEKK